MNSAISSVEHAMRKNGHARDISRWQLQLALRQRGAGAEPRRQQDPVLRPREHPRDRAQVLERVRRPGARPGASRSSAPTARRSARPGGRSARSPRRRPARGRSRTSGRPRARSRRGTRPAPRRRRRGARRQQRRDLLLERAAGQLGVGVLGGDDLALLGDPHAAAQRARRLGEDRLVRGRAAARRRAAAAVEERHLDAVLGPLGDELLLRAVDRPLAREEPASLAESE